MTQYWQRNWCVYSIQKSGATKRSSKDPALRSSTLKPQSIDEWSIHWFVNWLINYAWYSFIWMSYRQPLTQPSWVTPRTFEQNIAHVWVRNAQPVTQHLRLRLVCSLKLAVSLAKEPHKDVAKEPNKDATASHSTSQRLRDMSRIEQMSHGTCMTGSHGAGSISRLDQIIGLFCKI